MANPAGNHQDASTSSSALNANGAVVPDDPQLKHNPGISLVWTAEEQAILEDGLVKYASLSSIVKYAKIAVQMNNKTVRDVAMRCRWMTKKESSKRRKEENNLSKKSKDKKEKVADLCAKSSQFAARPNVPPYAPPPFPVDNDDGISCKAIGGPAGELLEQNAQAFNQISANLSAFKVKCLVGNASNRQFGSNFVDHIISLLRVVAIIQDNISLFCQTRDNILKFMNDITDHPEIMKQMPPLPVKVNEELANTILPRTSRTMQS